MNPLRKMLPWHDRILLLDPQGRVFLCKDSSHISVNSDVLVVDHLLVRNWSYWFRLVGFFRGVIWVSPIIIVIIITALTAIDRFVLRKKHKLSRRALGIIDAHSLSVWSVSVYAVGRIGHSGQLAKALAWLLQYSAELFYISAECGSRRRTPTTYVYLVGSW